MVSFWVWEIDLVVFGMQVGGKFLGARLGGKFLGVRLGGKSLGMRKRLGRF